MEATIIRIGEYIIHTEDHVIIKNGQFCKDSIGSDGWKLLKQLIADYPNRSSVETLDRVLEDSFQSEDIARRRTKGITKLRNLFGDSSIVNQYSYSYSFTLCVRGVSQEAYDVFYYECSKRKDQDALLKKGSGRPITITNLDGSTEEVHLVKSFGIVDLDKDFVILSKETPISQNKYKNVFVSEVIEASEGVFELKGIDTPGLLAAVRIACIEMSCDENSTDRIPSNLQLAEQIVNKKSSLEKIFLEYPHTRKYFFEDRDKMPESKIEYQQVIAIANMFAPLFFEIESTAKKLPSAFMDYLLKYERNIYQSKAVEDANKLTPENWQYLETLPVI